MADDPHAAHDGANPEMDYAEHERTYRMFVLATKWGTAAALLTLVFLAIFTL
jgi:aa3 type cytochrome c oxidase subunit IV